MARRAKLCHRPLSGSSWMTRWLLGAVVTVACHTGAPELPRPLSSPFERATDSLMFATIVKTVGGEVGFSALRVQPLPLPADPGVTYPLVSHDPMTRGLVVARRATLKSLGIATIMDAANGTCPIGSYLAGATVICPTVREVRLSIGPPRIGGAYLPSTGIDDRESGTRRARQSVRAVIWDLGPGSRGSAAWDFVFERRDAMWTIVERVKVEHID